MDTGTAKVGVATFLSALGLTAPVGAVFGGVLFGLSGTLLMLSFKPVRSHREKWMVWGSAVFFMVLAMYVHEVMFTHWPLQAILMVVGPMGRFIGAAAANFGATAADKSGDAAKNLIDKYTGGASDKGEGA